MAKTKIPAVQVCKARSLFGDCPIKVGGVQVGTLAFQGRNRHPWIQVSLVTDQYFPHVLSQWPGDGDRDTVKKIVEQWLREHVFLPSRKCKKVHPWGGWGGWVEGAPVSPGSYHVVYRDQPQDACFVCITKDHLHDSADIIAHRLVEVTESPFLGIKFK